MTFRNTRTICDTNSLYIMNFSIILLKKKIYRNGYWNSQLNQTRELELFYR